MFRAAYEWNGSQEDRQRVQRHRVMARTWQAQAVSGFEDISADKGGELNRKELLTLYYLRHVTTLWPPLFVCSTIAFLGCLRTWQKFTDHIVWNRLFSVVGHAFDRSSDPSSWKQPPKLLQRQARRRNIHDDNRIMEWGAILFLTNEFYWCAVTDDYLQSTKWTALADLPYQHALKQNVCANTKSSFQTLVQNGTIDVSQDFPSAVGNRTTDRAATSLELRRMYDLVQTCQRQERRTGRSPKERSHLVGSTTNSLVQTLFGRKRKGETIGKGERNAQSSSSSTATGSDGGSPRKPATTLDEWVQRQTDNSSSSTDFRRLGILDRLWSIVMGGV